MKKWLSVLLALSLLGTSVTALGAEEQPAPVPAWAYNQLADAYAMGLCGDEIASIHAQPIDQDQLEGLCAVVADKLAVLGVETRAGEEEPLVLDTTRGGVMNALYQEAAAYAFPGVEDGPEAFLTSLNVVKGDGSELRLDRTCTYIEAVTMANRLILALYDSQNAGSLGLLWRAVSGENTLYLLGTIHVDRSNIYPFHRQLRDILSCVDLAAFELDFGDAEGMAELAAMQVYSDGTTLKDHVSPELYTAVVEALAPLGMTEEMVAQYKAWALASTLQSLAMMDDTSGENFMAVDSYCYSRAVNAGVSVEGVETYAFQGSLFDTLSDEYQEEYLAGGLMLYQGDDSQLTEEEKGAVEANLAQLEAWMTCWKSRDAEGFAGGYDKEAILESGDELDAKLFADRDPHMIAYADAFLKREGSYTGILVVGAGHMVGETGIVQGLRDLGYTVEVVPAP